MQETDNCPVCNTICKLEIDKNISYAKCETCKTRWRRKDDSRQKIYEKWACRIPEFTFAIPFTGSSVKFHPKWCRWIKVKERYIPVGTADGIKTEETETQRGETFDETIAIESKDFSTYDFELKRGDKVEGKLNSNVPVDIWFMDERNFDVFTRGKRHPFVEDANVGIYETNINFEATRKDLWFVVIENSHKMSAKVKVNIYSLHKRN